MIQRQTLVLVFCSMLVACSSCRGDRTAPVVPASAGGEGSGSGSAAPDEAEVACAESRTRLWEAAPVAGAPLDAAATEAAIRALPAAEQPEAVRALAASGVSAQPVIPLGYVVSRLIEIRDKYGPDSIGFLVSAKCTNEENYLLQKVARGLIGTNNVDPARGSDTPVLSPVWRQPWVRAR